MFINVGSVAIGLCVFMAVSTESTIKGAEFVNGKPRFAACGLSARLHSVTASPALLTGLA